MQRIMLLHLKSAIYVPLTIIVVIIIVEESNAFQQPTIEVANLLLPHKLPGCLTPIGRLRSIWGCLLIKSTFAISWALLLILDP